MNSDEMKAYIDAYNARLNELDAEADKLDADARAEYEAERDNFRGRLDAWADLTEAQWDKFKANLEQQYHLLRAKWHERAE